MDFINFESFTSNSPLIARLQASNYQFIQESKYWNFNCLELEVIRCEPQI